LWAATRIRSEKADSKMIIDVRGVVIGLGLMTLGNAGEMVMWTLSRAPLGFIVLGWFTVVLGASLFILGVRMLIRGETRIEI
jgi:hypothetical protein